MKQRKVRLEGIKWTTPKIECLAQTLAQAPYTVTIFILVSSSFPSSWAGYWLFAAGAVLPAFGRGQMRHLFVELCACSLRAIFSYQPSAPRGRSYVCQAPPLSPLLCKPGHVLRGRSNSVILSSNRKVVAHKLKVFPC